MHEPTNVSAEKFRFHRGELVKILRAGTKNTFIYRVRDKRKFTVPSTELKPVPHDWICPFIESLSKPRPKEEPIQVIPPTPPQVKSVPDARAVRRKLLHLQLEPQIQKPREKKGPIPVRLFGQI